MLAQRSQVIEHGSGITLRQELGETLRRFAAPAGGAVDVGDAIGLDSRRSISSNVMGPHCTLGAGDRLTGLALGALTPDFRPNRWI